MDLDTIFQELDLSPDQIKELSETVKTNPMAAFALVQKFKINPELVQRLIAVLMANPQALEEAAKKMGVSDELFATVKSQLAPKNEPIK